MLHARRGAAAADTNEHELRLHELGHRFSNDLQAIGGLAEQAMRRCTDMDAAASLERIAGRARAVSVLYRHMHDSASEHVDVAEYLTELCEKIADTLPPDVCRLRVVHDLTRVELSVDRASGLAIVVNELVANAARHAFPAGRSGTITVRFQEVRPGRLALSVSDDGCGFAQARSGRRGLGIVDRLVVAVGGTLARGSGAGTTWVITFGRGAGPQR